MQSPSGPRPAFALLRHLRASSRGSLPAGGVAAALVRPRPAACDVERRPRLADRAKAGVFALLVLLGVAIAAPKLWAMTQPDPHLDPVAGDPAWLHVSDE